jgi:hypothetical protein
VCNTIIIVYEICDVIWYNKQGKAVLDMSLTVICSPAVVDLVAGNE